MLLSLKPHLLSPLDFSQLSVWGVLLCSAVLSWLSLATPVILPSQAQWTCHGAWGSLAQLVRPICGQIYGDEFLSLLGECPQPRVFILQDD